MAEYIEREKVVESIKELVSNMPAKDNYAKGYDAAIGRALVAVRKVSIADVQPVRKWVNDKISSPSVDGDYLVFYRGFFHVFERFKGKWYDEDRCDVITDLDKLWWQELPCMPEPIKG